MKRATPKNAAQRKNEIVGVRFSKPQIAIVEQRARARGMNISEHIRDLAVRDAESGFLRVVPGAALSEARSPQGSSTPQCGTKKGAA